MHTFTWEGEAYNEDESLPLGPQHTEVYIHHNGDYSGNVNISLPVRIGCPDMVSVAEDHVSMWVPFDAIKALVLEQIRSAAISKLEEMTEEEIEAYSRTGFVQ